MAGVLLPGIPDVLRSLDDQGELGPLLVLREVVAFLRGGEPALRRQAELIAVDIPGGIVDTPLEVVLALQVAALGGDQPEHDPLAGGNKAKRRKAAGSLVVPLAEEPVHVQ